MRRLFVASALMLATTSSTTAHADKSEGTAKALAIGGTALSSTLVVASILIDPEGGNIHEPTLYAGLGTSVITPSLGHLYSEQWLTIGMGIRAVAAGLAIYGLSQDQNQKCNANPNDMSCTTLTGTGFTLVALAAIAYIGGVAYDVRDAPAAARRHNKKRSTTSATLAPTAMPHGGGVSVLGSF